MKRKLIFEKVIDEMLSTPDTLHKVVDGAVVSIDPSEMAKALGSKGGKATSKKYGKEHYRKLAENMNKKRWGK